MKLRIATILLGILGCVTPCFAQTAGMLSFQGLIKNDQGELITGTVSLQFRIYDAESGDGLVDMNGDGNVDDVVGQDVKEVLDVNVTQGILATKFGPVSPKSFDGGERWLQVRVDGDPLSRIEMATAPATAEQLNRPASGEAAAIVDDAGNVGIGVATPSTKLDVDGAMSGFGVVPIGSIIAWHKNLAGVDAPPDGWLECNGSLADDPSTPIDETQLPDLNNSRRFLRGGLRSGTLEADASQGHKHHVDTDAGTELRASGGGINAWGSSVLMRDPSDLGRYKAQNPITDGTNGTPRTADETRPLNMSVVWIMRVK